MTVRSSWTVIEADAKNRIIFIEDICHLTGLMSVTNDAENVLQYFQQTHSKDWRVVYKDTDQEWWEIFWSPGWETGDWRIAFKPWHGLDWDILSQKETV